MQKISIILCFILSILHCKLENSVNQKIPPKAINGTLDLRNWDFAKDGIVSLDGDWEF